jgi:sugar/nucleoside kinase (ribokinase family)
MAMGGGLLIVGSVAYDTIQSPAGTATEVLGGSAIYGAAAASLFAPVHLVGVVGTDFALDDLAFLRRRGVDMTGLEVAEGKTFRWSGVYETDVNVRHTRSTELNVFAEFSPRVPDAYRRDEVIFLGNIAPKLQAHVLDQVGSPRWVALDTMDLWIRQTAHDLQSVLRRVHMIIVNDSEARMLTGVPALIPAARAILAMGPQAVVVKKGEHGVILATNDGFASLPALPLEHVADPTGAGDSFAGGMLGCLAATSDFSFDGLRRALAYGTATASLAVEAFSVERLREATRQTLEERYRWLQRIACIPDPLPARG